jgi:hypothetical protein
MISYLIKRDHKCFQEIGGLGILCEHISMETVEAIIEWHEKKKDEQPKP